MTDFYDRAAAREAEILSDALAAQRRRARNGLGAVSALACEDCGASIPEARRLAIHGVQRCVECQTVQERLAR